MDNEIKKILESVRYATISTVDVGGKPWAAPVWYVYDVKANIYWWSPINSQHSKNIEENPGVYITVFDSTAPEGSGSGLYFRAVASVVGDTELATAMDLYNQSTNIFKLNRSNCAGNAPTRMYKAVIKESWKNDGLERDGFYIDQRVSL